MGKNEELLSSLATISEDLAVEILSNYSQDDFSDLKPIIDHLTTVIGLLQANKTDIPFPVLELLRHASKAKGSDPVQ